MTREQGRAWSRLHRNGMAALVFKWPGGFSGGAAPTGGSASMAVNAGKTFEHAKEYADRASGCPQPCNCAPWEE